MQQIKLYKTNNLSSGLIPLPGSKSESNRALLVNALCHRPGEISNLALARDTEIMQKLLALESQIYDARDAGTAMRFMTAYLAVMNKNAQITGTEQMKKRPIGILVEALRRLGAEISYLEAEGYPPLQCTGLKEQKTSLLEIASDVSSQYISALLMVAPKLPHGLTLELNGKPVSTGVAVVRIGLRARLTLVEDVVADDAVAVDDTVVGDPDGSFTGHGPLDEVVDHFGRPGNGSRLFSRDRTLVIA